MAELTACEDKDVEGVPQNAKCEDNRQDKCTAYVHNTMVQELFAGYREVGRYRHRKRLVVPGRIGQVLGGPGTHFRCNGFATGAVASSLQNQSPFKNLDGQI